MMDVRAEIEKVLNENGVSPTKVLMYLLMEVVEDYGSEKYQLGCTDTNYTNSMDN